MKRLMIAAVSVLAIGMAGAATATAAETNNSGSKVGDKPAVSGTSQSPQAGANAPNTPSSLPSNANRPTGSMADPPLASPPAANPGRSSSPDK